MKTSMKFKKLFPKCFLIFSMMALIACVLHEKSRAYIMPAEQIIGYMAPKFSKIRTLVITQSTCLISHDAQRPQKVVKEELWLKGSGFMYSRIEEETEIEEKSPLESPEIRLSPDMAFRKLFMGNSSEEFKLLLSAMGINLDSVLYTRLDGIINYQIGDRYHKSPRLLIEKDTFLPLLISYRLPGDSAQRLVTVRFEKYREIAGGWYPYQITYSVGQDMLERYTITDLEVNVPIEPSVVENQGLNARMARDVKYGQDGQDEKRLRNIIRMLEEKYQ